MSRKKVMLSGITGFIPSITTVSLIQAGYDVVGFDNLSNSSTEPLNRIKIITGRDVLDFAKIDLRDARGLDAFVRKHQDTYAVVHFAGLKAVGESCAQPLEYIDNNVNGSIIFFGVLEKYNLRRMAFSSSATVYGNDNPVPFREDMPIGQGISPYANSKIMIEFMLRDMAKYKRWDVILLRYFNPVSAHPSGLMGEDPTGKPNNLMPFVSQVAVGTYNHKVVTIHGDDWGTPDGTGRRDYIHVVDLGDAHKLAVDKFDKPGAFWRDPDVPDYDTTIAVNIATGRPYSVKEVIEAYRRASGKAIPSKVGPRRPGDRAETYADARAAEAILGFKTRLDLDAMCRDAWNWQSKNPNGYRTA